MTTEATPSPTKSQLAIQAAETATANADKPTRLVADELGIPKDLVRAAQRILLWDAAVFAKVKDGTMSLHAAYKLLPKRTRQVADPGVASIVEAAPTPSPRTGHRKAAAV